ncbi:hypothetical protein [Candidatus Pyrohabitans sp.]
MSLKIIIAALPLFAFVAFDSYITTFHEGTHRYLYGQYGVDAEIIKEGLFNGRTIPNQTDLSRLSDEERLQLKHLNYLYDILDYSVRTLLFGLAVLLFAENCIYLIRNRVRRAR